MWPLAFRSLNKDEKLQKEFSGWYISPSRCHLCLNGTKSIAISFFIVSELVECAVLLLVWWERPFLRQRIWMIGKMGGIWRERLRWWSVAWWALPFGKDEHLHFHSFHSLVQNMASRWISLHFFFGSYSLLMILKDWKSMICSLSSREFSQPRHSGCLDSC